MIGIWQIKTSLLLRMTSKMLGATVYLLPTTKRRDLVPDDSCRHLILPLERADLTSAKELPQLRNVRHWRPGPVRLW
jgi:hypothetical protein